MLIALQSLTNKFNNALYANSLTTSLRLHTRQLNHLTKITSETSTLVMKVFDVCVMFVNYSNAV